MTAFARIIFLTSAITSLAIFLSSNAWAVYRPSEILLQATKGKGVALIPAKAAPTVVHWHRASDHQELLHHAVVRRPPTR
jgi:hypothetical protein